MDEELTHGSNDGAFVRFATVAKAFDIGRNDRVGGGCGESGHKEDLADLCAAALDEALARKLPTVAIERSDAREGNDTVAAESFDLAQVGQEGPGSDGADAFDRLDDFSAGFEAWLRLDEKVDRIFDGSDLLFQKANHLFDRSMDGVLTVLEAVHLAGEVLNQVATAVEKRSQFDAGIRRTLHGHESLALGKSEDHFGVDRVGFGTNAFTTGKVADPGRIDHGQRRSGLRKALQELAFITPGSFENHQRVGAVLEMLQELAKALRVVTDRQGKSVVQDLESFFGNVDCDVMGVLVVHRGFMVVFGLEPGFSRSCRGELAMIISLGLSQLFEIKPSSRRRSVATQ